MVLHSNILEHLRKFGEKPRLILEGLADTLLKLKRGLNMNKREEQLKQILAKLQKGQLLSEEEISDLLDYGETDNEEIVEVHDDTIETYTTVLVDGVKIGIQWQKSERYEDTFPYQPNIDR